ncbi:MAG: hypothetical protein HY720_27705 [Planctomycetes bacterium]|nr:hypothetical protein [Planctomycetota bacterium]
MAGANGPADRRIAFLEKVYLEDRERWQKNDGRWRETEKKNEERWQKNEERWRENEKKSEERWKQNEERWKQNCKTVHEMLHLLLRQGEKLDAALRVLHRIQEGR